MPPPDFFFALDLSDESHFERMMHDVIHSILGHSGFDKKAAAELGDELRRALADGVQAGGRHCDVTFEARDGRLDISIKYDRGPEWRATRPLP